MSVLTVGRADPIDNAASFKLNGTELQINGVIPTADIALAKAIRQQLCGYIDNQDEPVVAVTYAGDSTLDGFYTVRAANVDVGRGNLKIGHFPYNLTLERVAQYSLPLIEMIFLGALRTNSAGIAAGTDLAWSAIPAAAKMQGIVNGSTWGTAAGTHTGEDGGVLIYWSGATASVDHDCRIQYMILPASYYANAARLQVADAGATLRTIAGKQVTQSPTVWRITNGLLRVEVVTSGTSVRLSLAPYHGTQWDAAITFNFVNHGSGEIANTTPIAITVLRNSVEQIILRLSLTDGATLDLALRRGARLVYGRLTETDGTKKLGIIPTTTVAATTLTGGLRKTTNDGGGNRLLIASPNAITKDLTTGEVYLTAAAQTFDFAAGFETPGGTATTIETAQNLIYRYMAADTERLTVVGR